MGESRVLRTEKCWNGVLANGEEGMKKGSSGPHMPVPHFSGSAPPPPRTDLITQFGTLTKKTSQNWKYPDKGCLVYHYTYDKATSTTQLIHFISGSGGL